MAYNICRWCLQRSVYSKRKNVIEQAISITMYKYNRTYSTQKEPPKPRNCEAFEEYTQPIPEIDLDYLTNQANKEIIQMNIEHRKGYGDIDKVHKLWEKYKEHLLLNQRETEQNFLNDTPSHIKVDDYLQNQEDDLKLLKHELLQAAMDIPNITHPNTPIGDELCAKLIDTVGEKQNFDFKPDGIAKLGVNLEGLRTEHLGHSTGQKSYYFKGLFAQLQSALTRFVVDVLHEKGFEMVYVPDLIHPSVIEGCGFKSRGERTQVYHLEPHLHGTVSLAGTGEMPLAGMFVDSVIPAQQLPKKCMAVSQCYRAEVSDVEKDIYRVHQFTKVEMFGVTGNDFGDESENLVQEFLSIQKDIFSQLGLYFRILEMPSQELGSPAYRKFDMETWMPAKGFWGEISSTSNCLDYQSRRLGIKYWNDSDDQPDFVHTVNGTACAIPRLIMAIVENNQTKEGDIEIPEVLQPYMRDNSIIKNTQQPLKMRRNNILKNVKKLNKLK